MRVTGLIASCLLLIACGGPEPLAELEPSGTCWQVGEALEMQLDHPGGPLGVSARCELTRDYPFSNLYLEAQLTQAGGPDSSWVQTVTFVDRLGNWQIPRKGESFVLDHPVCMDVSQPPGNYTLKLRHYMRPEEVCGVRAVRVYSNPKP